MRFCVCSLGASNGKIVAGAATSNPPVAVRVARYATWWRFQRCPKAGPVAWRSTPIAIVAPRGVRARSAVVRWREGSGFLLS